LILGEYNTFARKMCNVRSEVLKSWCSRYDQLQPKDIPKGKINNRFYFNVLLTVHHGNM